MAKLSAMALVAYFQRAVEQNWGYVWSLNGEFYTPALAQKYHAIQRPTSKYRDPATYWLQDCAKWIGTMAADCSGGIVGALRTADPAYGDRSANTFFAQCVETGPILQIPEVPGLCVWLEGHIGVYEGKGSILEFRGTDYGCVRTKLSQRNFTHWGRLRDVDYGSAGLPGETAGPLVLAIQSPLLRGEAIAALQAALNGLGYPCGEADGIAGKKTMAGVAAFCAAHAAQGPKALPDTLDITLEAGGKAYRGTLAG